MKNIQHQHGAVLIISMIILLLLTILGVTSMRTTQLEERMAGNARDRHVAFEAAEAALVDAEQFVQTIVTKNPFDTDGSDGLYEDSSAIGRIEEYVDWSGGSPAQGYLTATNITTSEGIATPPKYVIQLIPSDESIGSDTVNLGNYGDVAAKTGTTLVRITARGTGTSDNSVVFLQTVFGLNNF